MRKTFLYPIIKKFQEGNVNWLFWQSINGFITKYLNKILPKKIITGPVMAVVLLTYRCNSKCIMCDLPQRALKAKDPEYTTKQWKNVIKQLADIHTGGIGFTGGEPLVRSDTPELITYAKSLGLATTLNTNAVLLHKDNIEKVLNAEPDNINISIDSIKHETYDFVRGTPNGFARMTQNTKQLVEERNHLHKKTKITIVVCVSEYNIDELDKIADLAVDLGADKIGFMPMHRIPDTKVYSNRNIRPMTCKSPKKNMGKLFLDKLAIIKNKNNIEIDNSSAYLNMFPEAFSGKLFPMHCTAGYTSITTDCYGNIFSCWPFLELKRPTLSLKDKNIRELWFGEEYNKIRAITDNCRSCFWNCQSELSIFYK